MEWTKTTGFDFVPYFAHPSSDPLNYTFDSGSQIGPPKIWSFPPSANMSFNQMVERVTVPLSQSYPFENLPLSNLEKKLLVEFEAAMGALGSSDDAERLASLIKQCRSLDIGLDINRIARYAVYHKRISCLRHLVDQERASLTQKDTFGRSAVFYSMATRSQEERDTDSLFGTQILRDTNDKDFSMGIQMLKYTYEIMSSQIQDGSKMEDLLGQPDANDWVPLQYAVHGLNLWAIEFLLAKCANPSIMHRLAEESISPVTSNLRELRINLVFEFNKLLPILSSYNFAIIGTELSEPNLMQLFEEARGSWSSSQESPLRYLTPNDNFVARLHVPCLNGIVVFGILRRYMRDFGRSRYDDHAFGRWLQESSPTIDFDRVNREPSYLSNGRYQCYSIVFPCLALRTKKNMIAARRKTKESRDTITQNRLKRLLQSERTIDETYFPSLSAETLKDRNNGQVVSRETKKKMHSGWADDDQIPMLMVPQLWIWRFDKLVLSAYSSVNAGHLTEEELQHLDRVSHSDTNIMVGRIIADHISQFGEPQINGKFPCPLDIFEMSILDVLSEVEAYANPSIESQLSIDKEQGFLFEIADIQEELAMIQDVLNQQLIIIDKFMRDLEIPGFGGLAFRTGWEELKLARTNIETYQKRVNKLNADAARIEKRIQDQLNLKRTYASIKEARSARVLSAAVIGFTVVTIIFAPLSFMTSLFALPLDSLQRNQQRIDESSSTNLADDSQNAVAYSTRYVGTWFAVAEIVSLAVTGLIVGLSLWLFSDSKAARQRQKPSGSKMEGRGGGRKDKQRLPASDLKEDNGSRFEKMSLRKTIIDFLRRLIDSLDRTGDVEEGQGRSARNATPAAECTG
ncbi:hypothetical protein F4680DRAFT_26332 [Xylaria scruposa]|nr:hypothetical protein F4680DRAFT_26332 [Xylaria scruposa]